MLRADSFFGCRPNTPNEILAASRSYPNATEGCSCSAAIRYFVADSTGASTRNPVGRRAGRVFTVARWAAHPHHSNRRRAKPHLMKTRHPFWKRDGLSSVLPFTCDADLTSAWSRHFVRDGRSAGEREFRFRPPVALRLPRPPHRFAQREIAPRFRS